MDRIPLNQFAVAISTLIPNKNHMLSDIPTSQTELNKMFKIAKDDGTYSSDPKDFGFTYAEAKAAFDKQKTDDELFDVREVRNKKLMQSDWVVIKEREEGGSVSNFADWKTYRQALRDITKTYKTLDDVKWPEEPS